MPDMNGGTVFQELRQIDRNIPVVLSSGISVSELSTRFDGVGFSGFLPKPYEYQALTEKLQAVLATKHRQSDE